MDDAPAVTIDDVAAVSPALAAYTRTAIIDGVWQRPGLLPRDRSIVTVAALVAGGRTVGYAHYFTGALANGVTAAELSEIVLQVGFYAGWPVAFSAVPILKGIFSDRGIGADQLPAVSPDLLPVEQALPADASRTVMLHGRFAATAPDLVTITEDLLYGEVWRRPDLTPRDRDLATLAAMIATGQTEFLPLYRAKATADGVSDAEVGEIVTHLAFYVGWPAALSAAATFWPVTEDRTGCPA